MQRTGGEPLRAIVGIDAPRTALTAPRHWGMRTRDIGGFARGPKDMRDAAVCVVVVREYAADRGGCVGGGDGLGTSVLPRPIEHADAPVLQWPSAT